MTKKLVLGLIASLFISAAPAAEWDVASMNKTIEQTNFMLNKGCSGTLISIPERLVLTAYHCIDSNIEVIDREVVGDDGFVKKIKRRRFQPVLLEQNVYDGFTKVGSATYQSEIVADDQKHDLALVKISGAIPQTYASPLLPGDQKVQRGERVYAVGNPAGNESTVVEGIVSNVNRTFEFPWTGGERLPMIQFSGGIYGGNSGGSLYNAAGQLVGVPAAGYPSATFIGLAMPISVVKGFLKDNCYDQDKPALDAKCVADKEAKKKKSKDE